MTSLAPTPDALRGAPLLAGCSTERLAELVARSTERALPAGELLFGEADVAAGVWVLLEGELEISKRADGGEVRLDQLAPGAFLGEISFLTGAPAAHQARACTPVRVLQVPGAAFRDLLATCETVAETVLRTMAERVRRIEHLLQRHERLATLGTVSAGLAHELNNPAAAVARNVGLLGETVAALQPVVRRLAARPWSDAELAWLARLAEAGRAAAPPPEAEDPLARSDREEALRDWLDGRGIGELDELVVDLLDVGITHDVLAAFDDAADAPPPDAQADALAWVAHLSALQCLVTDSAQAATRISELVRAVKEYAHLDTTVRQAVDVRAGLETTLKILGHKLRVADVRVRRELPDGLPHVAAHGTELHQVWTNLLDNAIDALAGRGGTITLRARAAPGTVVVEVADDGPGIPADALPHVFQPFFTTKEAGKGTGLGLEIVQRIVRRHGGAVHVRSRPGETVFAVELPVAEA